MFFCFLCAGSAKPSPESTAPEDLLALPAHLSALSYTKDDCGFESLGFNDSKRAFGRDWHFCSGLRRDILFIIVEGARNDEEWEPSFIPEEEPWNFSEKPAYVLKGFHAAATSIYNEVKPTIDQYQDKEIFFAGHSRGGGIAQLLHVRAYQDFPGTDIWSFSFGGPAVMSTAHPNVTAKMYSFRHDRDIVPLLGVQSIRYIFRDQSAGACKSFLDLVGLLQQLPHPMCKALVKQKDAIFKAINNSIHNPDSWHIWNQQGNLYHLLYWPKSKGMPIEPMPLFANEVYDFADNIYRAGDINDLTWKDKELFLTQFIPDHNVSLYLQFFKNAPNLALHYPDFRWASRLNSITDNSVTEVEPEWIPDLSTAENRFGREENVTTYKRPWWRCVQGWDGERETLECHLPARGCATRILNQGSKRTYIGSQCWKLNHAKLPNWMPPYSHKCYAKATKGKHKVQFEDGKQWEIRKTSKYFAGIWSDDKTEGRCSVAIRTIEETGESWDWLKETCSNKDNWLVEKVKSFGGLLQRIVRSQGDEETEIDYIL